MSIYHQDLRQKNYLVCYIIDPGVVTVTDVLYGASNIHARLQERHLQKVYLGTIWVQQIANELNFKKNVSKDMVKKKKRTTGNGLYKLGKRDGIISIDYLRPRFSKIVRLFNLKFFKKEVFDKASNAFFLYG